ncbi:MAG: Ubiquitin fusion degradation protein 4 [Chaenotheca gracillima]|nr:MAG: Ubiquitin fusion degradation protein 4 [Chaenotheca gracillima]
MSSRVTRSAARQAADAPNTPATQSSSTPNTRSARGRPKRKASPAQGSPENGAEPAQAAPSRSSKRRRVAGPGASPPAARSTRSGRGPSINNMSHSGAPSETPGESSATAPPGASDAPKRKSSRPKKSSQDQPSSSTPTASTRRARSTKGPKDAGPLSHEDHQEHLDDHSDLEDDEEDGTDDGLDPHDDDDPFTRGYLGGAEGPPPGLSSTLRALSGMMSGVSSRLRAILTNLRQKDDPSIQLIALQELSEILLVSTEDNLSGHFSSDQFVKELVILMQPSEAGEENPEMMLLACRCIANLMEALPASTGNVVYGGAVPILCAKLLEIHFIDLAEQALSTLEKISVEFGAPIIRAGGLEACLSYLDFFATSTQRTAVTTAANCCRSIPADSFSVIRDVMPILLNVLGSSDQKVVEQGCLCVSRIVESFREYPDKLEKLVSTDLLKAITRLLVPGTTNLIGPNIHTQFLRVLAFTAKASPTLSAELFKMNIVDTLYQILTGVSPPNGTEDVASQIDSVVIMQALIHRPREQALETLNVICELLPGAPPKIDAHLEEVFPEGANESGFKASKPDQKRVALLKGCSEELKRFAIILLPTLTDVYSSTVNLSVRQKVLDAHLKMLSNIDTSVLEDALRAVPYASFLASILSQKDHHTLVRNALRASELLLHRLEDIYRYQFYREGVISEIAKLAAVQPKEASKKAENNETSHKREDVQEDIEPPKSEDDVEDSDPESHSDDADGHDDGDTSEDGDENPHDEITASPTNSQESSDMSERIQLHVPVFRLDPESIIATQAKQFMDFHENERSEVEMRKKASKILQDLRDLAWAIKSHYTGPTHGNGRDLFTHLATYFDGDALESITSSELLNSGMADVLLEIFTNTDGPSASQAQAEFLEVFMGKTTRGQTKTISSKSPSTPFSALIHKLQDLLSRAEHFEVVTVHQHGIEGNRSSAASMLAKQIRLKLIADEESEIPRPYRNIMVSIHAIATFKALDDYLRPRISLSDRPRVPRHREGGVSSALAAFAAAAGLPNPSQRMMDSSLPSNVSTMMPAPPAPAENSSRPPKRHSKKKTPTEGASDTPSGTAEGQEKPPVRRSTRRHSGRSEAPPPPPPPPPPFHEPEETRDQLECADEQQVDEDEEGAEAGGPLDTIVDDLDDEMDEEPLTDPTAVNLEVASTGKVTARKEDGTRVATPSQQAGQSLRTPASLPASSSAANSTPTSSARHLSYAAAIQSVPQDWHIEFSIDGTAVSGDTTIYRAVHQNQGQAEDSPLRNVWSAIHSVKFKRVPGPPPPEPSTLTPPPEGRKGSEPETTASGLPVSLDKNPTTSSIFRLLNILHALNANLEDVLTENVEAVRLNAEPLAQFVNTKLTAKLNRQLEEPLIVASNTLPSWSEDLARLYPFLFPFETRHLFLQSTSFGYSRSMTRWQNAQSNNDTRSDRHRDDRPFLGRLQRQKVRISRTRILESALKVMELYGASPSVLEVEYFEEVGTGLGPTLEFYSSVSKEFSKKKLKLWRENESSPGEEFAYGKRGLFPAPMSTEIVESENGKKILHLFKILGKFVARSMLDSRIIDVSFNPTFFRIGDGVTAVSPSLGAVKAIDHDLATSLKLMKQFANAKKKIDEDKSMTADEKTKAAAEIEIQGAHVNDLELDFTLPGYPSIELSPDGSNTAVTIDNVGLYVERVLDLTLGSGVRKQIDAFKTGFSLVFPYRALRAFTPDELVMLFGRVDEDWSLETLLDSIKADHGFNMDSRSVRNLLQTMSELSLAERREFLQFVTGSPKLPIGGFKSLTPMFTVVCKPSEPPYASDDYLPSVMTCVNYLKLPDYTDLDVMRRRLTTATKEGQGAFHLS